MKIIKRILLFLFCTILSFGVSNTLAPFEENLTLHIIVLLILTLLFYFLMLKLIKKIRESIQNSDNQE